MTDQLKAVLEQIPEMKSRFERAPDRYRALHSNAHASIAKFEWCAAPRYANHPFDIERSGWKRGRVLKHEPASKDGKYRYGIALDGRVMLEEQYVQFDGQRYETFWEHSEAQICSVHFSYFPEKPVINVEATFLTAGIPVGFLRYAQRGLLAESYEYEDGLLVRAHQAAREHDPKSKNHELTSTHFDFEYLGEQVVKIVHIWESGAPEVVFP